MEKKINKKIAEYISTFKNDIKEKAELINTEENLQLLQYIYDYERLTITKDDISKRKRVKSNVPCSERCLALRSCSSQCSRRRSVSSYYCGTHKKGIPHGSLSCSEASETQTQSVPVAESESEAKAKASSECGKKVEVCAHEIDGIMYYLDNIKNVYSPEDIHMQKYNPTKIGTYNQIGDKIQIQLF
jgi:predicted ATP-binding protein involved in virulence